MQQLSRHAYLELIAENLAWLEKQPRTLEREHIELIVRRSAGHEYDRGRQPQNAIASPIEVDFLRSAAARQHAELQELRERLAKTNEALRFEMDARRAEAAESARMAGVLARLVPEDVRGDLSAEWPSVAKNGMATLDFGGSQVRQIPIVAGDTPLVVARQISCALKGIR